MGSYKFKPESILEFSCTGIGTSSSQSQAVSLFNNYLNLTGITADEDGYLDVDQFLTSNEASDAILSNLTQQHINQYTDKGAALYNGYLYNSYASYCPTAGYITLPFLNNGSNIRLVLPGTIVHFCNIVSSGDVGTGGIITRNKNGFSIKQPGTTTTTTIPNTFFHKNVTPLFLAVTVQGGGGGGSTSEALVAGRGGGGGGFTAGILSFLSNSSYYFDVGKGGRGGYHTEGTDSDTSSNHDGVSGNTSRIYTSGSNVTILSATGGYGGLAQGTSCRSGGTWTCNPAFQVKYKSGASYYAFTGVNGGSGSVDTATTGSSITGRELTTSSNVSLFKSVTIDEAVTRTPGTSYNPGGGGGGRNHHDAGGAAFGCCVASWRRTYPHYPHRKRREKSSCSADCSC